MYSELLRSDHHSSQTPNYKHGETVSFIWGPLTWIDSCLQNNDRARYTPKLHSTHIPALEKVIGLHALPLLKLLTGIYSWAGVTANLFRSANLVREFVPPEFIR